jgi:hypothetical protein
MNRIWTNLTPPSTSLCAENKTTTTTNLLDKVISSPACTIRFALTLMTVTTISLDDRQTASEQSDGVPLPVLQRRPPFGPALPRKTRFFTYMTCPYCRSPSLPVLSGEQDVLQACVDNLADFPSLSPSCPVLFRAL